MQQRNPNVPGIVNKIFMPQQRGNLSRQTRYWKEVLGSNSVNCIYSGRTLNADNVSIDHYLPWSFVAHDQLWNLIPVIPEANSAKTNNLPNQQYFNAFVFTQHLGLTIFHEKLGESAWSKVVESFISDLRVEPRDLLDLEKLRNAYQTTVQPLITLATKQGFAPDWIYK